MTKKMITQILTLRFFLRASTLAMAGLQATLCVIFLIAGSTKDASSAFTLTIWMVLAYAFETKAHNLQEQKDSLEAFLLQGHDEPMTDNTTTDSN